VANQTTAEAPAPAPRKAGCFLGTIYRFVWRVVGFVISLVVFSLYCWMPQYEDPHFDAEAARGITYTPPSSLVPGPAIPQDLGLMSSNNVLDLAEYRGKYYLVFRTAPTHYASRRTRIIVLTSPDRKQWTKDGEFQVDHSDLRESRFLVFKDKLFLYFFQAGKNPLAFEPQGIFATERGADGAWTAPRPIYKPGYVVWRAKARGDMAYMSVYYGKGLYSFWKDREGELRLLTSTDGYDWKPISEQPQLIQPGAEEGDFEFDAEGNLVVVARLEVDGALICTASKDDLAHWKTTFTKYKYDEPFLFRRGNDFYLVARRNVAGAFDRELTNVPGWFKRGWNLLRYSQTRKRTALYKVDPVAGKVTPLFDFPSCGDTAYAALIPLDNRSYATMYYSTPFGPRDPSWTIGQVVGCNIYETTLTFPE
jgi:hypothetical protein